MKNDRKKAILDIVSKYEVDTQETLQALLMERGFSVTQATVSRDIKELSLLKTMGVNGNYKYSLPPRAVENNARTSFSTIFSDAVLSVDRAMNTVVIKCSTGMANAVCSKGIQRSKNCFACAGAFRLRMRSRCFSAEIGRKTDRS